MRDLYVGAARSPERIASVVDDDYVDTLARALTGELGGKVGIAPRLFLRKLVQDVLDRVDEHADFDPRVHYALTLNAGEMTDVERNAAAPGGAGDVALDLS